MIELWGSLLTILCTILTTGAFCLFCDSLFPRRLAGWRYRVCVICFLLMVVVRLSVNNINLKLLLEILTECIFCMFAYRSRWDRCFFAIVTLSAIAYSFAYWSDRFVMILFGLTYKEYLWNILLYSFCFFGRAALLLLLMALVKKLHRPRLVGEKPVFWLVLSCVFPLMTLLIRQQASLPAPEQPIWQICLVVLDLVDAVALFLFDYMEGTALEREQLIAVSERARVQDENVGALTAAYGAQRKMTHDFRAHLATLSELLAGGDIETAQRYLDDLRVHTTERVLLVNSHHAAIDAVLNQKGYQARRQGIDMRLRINDLSPLRLPAKDITVVLGNLLDNALDACTGFSEDERWVDIRLLYQKEDDPQKNGPPLLQLVVINPSGPLRIENGRIITSKKDAMLHGFGLQNVRDILEQYHAKQSIRCEDGRFVFRCSWPDMENPPDL